MFKAYLTFLAVTCLTRIDDTIKRDFCVRRVLSEVIAVSVNSVANSCYVTSIPNETNVTKLLLNFKTLTEQ